MNPTHKCKVTGQQLEFVNYVGANEMEMKDTNGIILTYQEKEIEPIFTKLWFVEIYTKNRHSQKYSLIDIVEKGYKTKAEAEEARNQMQQEQEIDNNNLLELYTKRLQSFVMDETTEDTEPVLVRYSYKHEIKEYYFNSFAGFKSIEEGKEVTV